MNTENTNNSDCFDTVTGMFRSTGPEGTSDTPEQMAKKNYPAIISSVTSYFGGNITPLVMRMDDERISAPLRNLPDKNNFNKGFDTIAVPCGSPSDGLCAIVMLKKNEDSLKQILDVNPHLLSAPRTHWRDYLIIWLRILDWLPKSHLFAGFAWVADGYVPVLDVMPHMKDKTLPTTPGQSIPSLNFEDVKWPVDARNHFLLQRTNEVFGGILYAARGGKVEINHRAVTHYLQARDRPIFDGRTGGITYWPSNLNVRTKVSEANLKLTILETLHQLTEGHRAQFPVSKINSADVKAIVELLRHLCTKDSGNEQDGLVRFVEERIESRVGAAVTTKEMYCGYAHYCRRHDLPLYPEKWFLKEIPGLVQQRFAVLKSHCVRRPTPDGGRVTARNGFYNLIMKDEQDAKDGSGAKGGTDG